MLTADLTGERVLITGGASGIGRAASLLFARCGAVVAVNHLADDPRGEETVAEINAGGAQALSMPGDVSDPKSVDTMVATAVDTLGGLDILICNAGTPGSLEPIPHDDLDAMTEEFWSKLLSTNLIGPFRCIRAARQALTESKGVVVSTASIAGLGGNASSVAYGASKAGLINVTRNLARALGPDIRVNAVAPGLTRTPWTEPWPVERKARSVENTMLKRMVEPDEIAQAMLYLAVNGAVTGQTVVVDCGRMF